MSSQANLIVDKFLGLYVNLEVVSFPNLIFCQFPTPGHDIRPGMTQFNPYNLSVNTYRPNSLDCHGKEFIDIEIRGIGTMRFGTWVTGSRTATPRLVVPKTPPCSIRHPVFFYPRHIVFTNVIRK